MNLASKKIKSLIVTTAVFASVAASLCSCGTKHIKNEPRFGSAPHISYAEDLHSSSHNLNIIGYEASNAASMATNRAASAAIISDQAYRIEKYELDKAIRSPKAHPRVKAFGDMIKASSKIPDETLRIKMQAGWLNTNAIFDPSLHTTMLGCLKEGKGACDFWTTALRYAAESSGIASNKMEAIICATYDKDGKLMRGADGGYAGHAVLAYKNDDSSVSIYTNQLSPQPIDLTGKTSVREFAGLIGISGSNSDVSLKQFLNFPDQNSKPSNNHLRYLPIASFGTDGAKVFKDNLPFGNPPENLTSQYEPKYSENGVYPNKGGMATMMEILKLPISTANSFFNTFSYGASGIKMNNFDTSTMETETPPDFSAPASHSASTVNNKPMIKIAAPFTP